MTTREHPADRQQCPGCGREDLTAQEQHNGKCDRCNYGRVDTTELRRALYGLAERNMPEAINHAVAAVEAADLYAAEQSAERLGILNECLDALPQLATLPQREAQPDKFEEGILNLLDAGLDVEREELA